MNADWHSRFYAPGKDAFQYVWDDIARDVGRKVKMLVASHQKFQRGQRSRSRKGEIPRLSELQEIKVTRDLAFARFLAPRVYDSSLREVRNGRLRIASLPDQTTEDWLRIQAFAAKDQQITARYDAQYQDFADQIGPMYERWQNDLFVFSHEARKAARRTRVRQIIGGAVFLAGLASFPSEPEPGSNLYSESLATYKEEEDLAGAIVTLGSAVLVSSLFSKSKRNRNLNTLNERSQDFNHHFEPVNLVIQGKSLTLQGRMDSQFVRWRQTLLELYESEQTSANEITIVKR